MQQEAPNELPDDNQERPLVSQQTMEIIVSLALIAFAAIVIWDSVRLGFGWIENQGPAPGFFPFIVAALLGGSSIATLLQAMFAPSRHDGGDFTSVNAFGRILCVLIPLAVYIGAIHIIGFYVSSALFIAGFMMCMDRTGIFKSIAVGVSVPLFLFFMFEKWFLVPLPKGPLEAFLGY